MPKKKKKKRKESAFRKGLKRLFSSDAIVRHVGDKKLKIIDTDGKKFQSVIRGSNKYKRIRQKYGTTTQNSAHGFDQQRAQLFQDYECLAGETKIPLPNGAKVRIDELANKYPDSKEKFYVYSYDHKNDVVKLGEAHSVRKTKTELTYKVTFDNGEYLLATANHPFLMRNGKYKRVDELKLNESIMPYDFNNYLVSSLNHKIISIEPYKKQDVYDMTVEKYHNFATKNCFVHNSMDEDPIISSALDVYADESTTLDEYGDLLVINSDDKNIKEILHNLFYDILNIDFNLWSWIRNMCKYGDSFLQLDIHDEFGIINVIPQSSYDVQRVEGEDPLKPKAYHFVLEGDQRNKIEAFEMAHFRLYSDSNFLPYGKSMIEGARKPWKQLSLMEDAMLIHRIMRAPEKRIFEIDVGNIPPDEVDTYMDSMIEKMKKTPYINPQTGEYNLKYNMQNLLEDFYIAVRGGDSGTNITTTSGMAFDTIEDIDYVKNRMMSALKIPKPFLGYEEGVEGKATLAAMDLRFARTIERIQKIVVSELYKLAAIHLYAQGYEDENLVNFDLNLTSPSIVYEEEKIAIWEAKSSLVRDLRDLNMISEKYIYDKIFNLSKDEVKKMKAELVKDKKKEYRLETIMRDGRDPAKENDEEEDSMGGSSGGRFSFENVDEDEDDNSDELDSDKKRKKKGSSIANKLFHDSKPRLDKSSHKHRYKGNGPLSLEALDKFLKKKREKREKKKEDIKLLKT